MDRQPREILVRNLLRAEWDQSETFGLTPDISFGWYVESKGVPQLLVRAPDEGPLGGGETGYDAIDGSGGIPNQTISGVIDVHGMADASDLDAATTDFPDVYLSGNESQHGAMAEVRRIARENYSAPTDPETGNRPVNTLAPGDSQEVPDDGAGTREAHYLVEVGYTFTTN